MKITISKLNLTQILTIVAVVQAFASEVIQAVKGKKGAALRDAIVKAVRSALPTLETLLGKDLLNDEKFNAALTALVDAFTKAPARRKK